MFVFKTLLLAALVACTFAQGPQGPTTTPVPILKQINRQNDDGSYSYGYEAADGSFKIETKYPSGDVAGKYGYIDQAGKLIEISYGASSKRGFEPQGNGIVVPPPTLNDNPTNALTDGQEDDGQYREDPKIYEDPKYNGRAASRPSGSFRQFLQPARKELQYQPQPQHYPAQTQQYQSQNQQYQQEVQPSQLRSTPLYSQQTSLFNQPQSNVYNQAPQQFSQPQSQVYHQQPQFSFQSYTPQYSGQNYQSQNYQNQNYQYPNQNFNPFSGHPAQNFDPSTGSYTINFTGK